MRAATVTCIDVIFRDANLIGCLPCVSGATSLTPTPSELVTSRPVNGCIGPNTADGVTGAE